LTSWPSAAGADECGCQPYTCRRKSIAPNEPYSRRHSRSVWSAADRGALLNGAALSRSDKTVRTGLQPPELPNWLTSAYAVPYLAYCPWADGRTWRVPSRPFAGLLPKSCRGANALQPSEDSGQGTLPAHKGYVAAPKTKAQPVKLCGASLALGCLVPPGSAVQALVYPGPQMSPG